MLAAAAQGARAAGLRPDGGSAALGYSPVVLDLVVNLVVMLTVVAAVRAVGTVLVVAFIVTPAAAARLVSTPHPG